MSLIDILLLAVALGIDCFVVSFSQGLIFKNERVKNSLSLALTMGFFQGFMPIIGYVAAGSVYSYLLPFNKIIVAIIFYILGIHFILESFSNRHEEQICCIGFKCLIGLGIATGIDALISGVTIKLTFSNLFLCMFLFGLMSIIMSECGFWIGNSVKNIPTKYLLLLGGGILVILGTKSLM